MRPPVFAVLALMREVRLVFSQHAVCDRVGSVSGLVTHDLQGCSLETAGHGMSDQGHS